MTPGHAGCLCPRKKGDRQTDIDEAIRRSSLTLEREERRRMTWKGYGRKRSRHNLRYYPDIRMEGLRKTTNTISQDSLSQGREGRPHVTGLLFQRDFQKNKWGVFPPLLQIG
jgi:hypothetical protein